MFPKSHQVLHLSPHTISVQVTVLSFIWIFPFSWIKTQDALFQIIKSKHKRQPSYIWENCWEMETFALAIKPMESPRCAVFFINSHWCEVALLLSGNQPVVSVNAWWLFCLEVKADVRNKCCEIVLVQMLLLFRLWHCFLKKRISCWWSHEWRWTQHCQCWKMFCMTLSCLSTKRP